MKTPEEIIQWCDMMLECHPNTEDTNFFNSIKDYIKQQQPQSDLISREALKEEITKCQIADFIAVQSVLDIINNAPTEELNCEGCTTWSKSTELLKKRLSYLGRPQGEWEILKGNYFTGGGDLILICPFCHSEESKHRGGIEFPVNWDYCPHCGAVLREKNP